MSEVRFAVGDADAGLADRLDKEISAFNATVTGHHDGRMLSVAVRFGCLNRSSLGRRRPVSCRAESTHTPRHWRHSLGGDVFRPT